MKKTNKINYEELYNILQKDYNEEIKENKYLQGEIESLKNYKHKIDMECNKQFGKTRELSDELNKLKNDYRILKEYTKHIQEYLCKDIFELTKDIYGDYEDYEDYED